MFLGIKNYILAFKGCCTFADFHYCSFKNLSTLVLNVEAQTMQMLFKKILLHLRATKSSWFSIPSIFAASSYPPILWPLEVAGRSGTKNLEVGDTGARICFSAQPCMSYTSSVHPCLFTIDKISVAWHILTIWENNVLYNTWV